MVRTPLAWLVVMFAACSVGGEVDEELEEDEYVDPGIGPGDGKMDGATSVQSVASSSCSTIPVRGLSLQIAEEMRCLAPDLLVPFAETSTIKFHDAAVLPYLASDTAVALRSAAASIGSVEVNSGLRSVAQQYLIKRWRDTGRCRIRAAAPPGRSNHETGRAVDLSNHAAARAVMRRLEFSTVRNDPVHFEHLDSQDLREVNVQAFQRLWNRNHPDDKIGVTGRYDTATATRLGRSPSGGFAVGARCD